MYPKFPEKTPFDPKRYDYYICPEFEFDPAKSASNRIKHGVDFVEAQRLWQDENRYALPMRSAGETREGLVGRIGSRHWIAIYTLRNGKVRIISVRRARDEEKESYREDP